MPEGYAKIAPLSMLFFLAMISERNSLSVFTGAVRENTSYEIHGAQAFGRLPL